ncbi:class I histocompatibility antigen, F10 alpha chain [Lates calcarifer]|uniref:Class I histocompatibility antigen, F10 alpha chain n=1 Tax=Lates calcarifer TaxID=8187 RepID=A0A4W6D4F3_LATCA|nr:class I histocompatibility antigen, F10 alpha chain [Lates calcarifer]
MKTVIYLVLLGINSAASVIHSLKYFYTGSSHVPNFPEFVSVGSVDEVQMIRYDSSTETAEPKQDWMKKVTEDNPEYLAGEAEHWSRIQQAFKANIQTAKQRFNQTAGVHIAQRMFGCEWDNETGEVKGYDQHGYDGEDFIVFDLKTETWIAPKPQAVITKLKWDDNKASIAQWKNYLTQVCPEWLKKYVNYGRSSLLRTALPSVSLLQKTPSSPVSCHATGFYPDRAMMFWRKDGEELHEDVDRGEILPNNDGTFQMRADLNISSVSPEDWRRYDCVFQLSGVKEDIITKLDKAEIRTNWGKTGIRETSSDVTVPITAAVVVVALVLFAVSGFVVYKTKKGKSEKSSQQSETSSHSSDNSAKGSDKEPDTLSFNYNNNSSTESADSNKPLMKR